MHRTIALTPAQWNEIEAACAGKPAWMTREELASIGNEIARTVRIPYLGGGEEAMCLARCVRAVDAALCELLPPEVRALAHDPAQGMSEDQANVLRDRLAPLLAERVRLPVLPARDEEQLQRTTLEIVARALRKGRSLLQPDTL